jgi:2-oxoglutarate ferredoxin oxidoreductase subunit alpha
MDVGVITWGSTFGAALEAVKQAQAKGFKVGALKISSLFPFHEEEIRNFMAKCRDVLIPELNFEGQLANLIGHLHHKDIVRLNRVTGIPITASMILEKIEELI